LSKLPTEIGEVECLQRLDLSNNHITDFPNELVKLKGLIHLDTNGNNLNAGVNAESHKGIEPLFQLLKKRKADLDKSK
jgi:Leucine-rich repeat (LRR) protein